MPQSFRLMYPGTTRPPRHYGAYSGVQADKLNFGLGHYGAYSGVQADKLNFGLGRSPRSPHVYNNAIGNIYGLAGGYDAYGGHSNLAGLGVDATATPQYSFLERHGVDVKHIKGGGWRVGAPAVALGGALIGAVMGIWLSVPSKGAASVLDVWKGLFVGGLSGFLMTTAARAVGSTESLSSGWNS